MSNYVLLDGNSVVQSTRGEIRDGFVLAPDHVICGYEFIGGNWQKSSALLASEAADAEKLEKRQSVANMVATARQWKVDADAAVAAWDGQTTAQRFAACKILMGRFGTMADKLADLIEGHLI